ncbi:SRPBCC family protein [Halovivax gelatinilyticus]|uniref:SRPBCC family protein n=1 Tax=Halovivax gelatinilyticus TaxID=2961597 RepID=UPI0020CA6ED6|nr:SRPBCC family protein [Halovivax gelatinilyticus]
MDRILLSTVVYREPAAVFEAVRSFSNYPAYAEHLDEVTCDGDGGVGTRYGLHFSWWKLSYTVRSAVTEIDEPRRLGWKLTADLDATGEWRIEPLEPDGRPDIDEASRLYFEVRYDPHSADPDTVSLPRFVSLDWVVRRVRPRLYDEAERVLGRLVEDVEGDSRNVELVVHDAPGSSA